MRTLVVEDDHVSQLLLQQFLSRYGECQVAMNGKAGVEAFRLSKKSGIAYNLICMDVMMPEMDGQTALREIRALEEPAGVQSSSGVKIIMVTALDDVKNVVESFKGLCDAYVFKPIDTGELLKHLKSLSLVP